jgi:hypothetical protein
VKHLFRPWSATLVLYLAYLAVILGLHGGDPLALAKIGNGPNQGYDGQFTYLIAVDPRPSAVIHEIAVVRADVPAYRYQRILLPMAARLLGMGQPGLIAWAIPLLNLTAQLAAVAVMEQLLVLVGVSRWYALVYGLYPGLAVAVRADLTEPWCYGLVAGSYLLHWRKQPWLSALAMGLALFSKETALLFVGAQMADALLSRDVRRIIALSAFAAAPFVVWQLTLRQVFGSFGLGSGGYLGTPFEVIPFNGVWQILPAKGLVVLAVFMLFLGPWVMLPAIWGIITAGRKLWEKSWHPYVWALAANSIIIPFTPFSTFREPVAMLRFSTGLVMAVLLFGGLNHSRRVLNYSWLWLAMLFWLRE